jgi:hypothetical protein
MTEPKLELNVSLEREEKEKKAEVKNKKKWIKPELIVLTNGCQDENVLCICKQGSYLEGQRIDSYCVPMCHVISHGVCCPSKVTNAS